VQRTGRRLVDNKKQIKKNGMTLKKECQVLFIVSLRHLQVNPLIESLPSDHHQSAANHIEIYETM
jgi:hypothetical protein